MSVMSSTGGRGHRPWWDTLVRGPSPEAYPRVLQGTPGSQASLHHQLCPKGGSVPRASGVGGDWWVLGTSLLGAAPVSNPRLDAVKGELSPRPSRGTATLASFWLGFHGREDQEWRVH